MDHQGGGVSIGVDVPHPLDELDHARLVSRHAVVRPHREVVVVDAEWGGGRGGGLCVFMRVCVCGVCVWCVWCVCVVCVCVCVCVYGDVQYTEQNGVVFRYEGRLCTQELTSTMVRKYT